MTTMIRRAGWPHFCLLACFALPVLPSCNASHTNRGTDSTTHWLERCSLDADCGQLSCLCGRCSARCEDDSACARFGSVARCETTGASCASASVPAMCVAQCAGNADCAALDHGACRDGRCVSDPSDPPAIDASKNLERLDGSAGSVSAASGAVDEDGVPLGPCGEPWYRCPEACDGQLTVRGGGRRYVPCFNDCYARLSILPSTSLDAEPCHDQFVQLTIQDVNGYVRKRMATLTDYAWSQLARVSIALDELGSQPMSCSDCADVDTAWITVPGSDQLESELSYRSFSPPEPLLEADALVQALIDRVAACEEGALIRDCTDTTPLPVLDNPAMDSCNFKYTNAELGPDGPSPGARAVTCDLPLDQTAPCRAAVACMCSRGVLEPGFSDPALCEQSWLTPGGAITFSDFCHDGPGDALRSLRAALELFAAAHGHAAQVGPGCDQLPAYY